MDHETLAERPYVIVKHGIGYHVKFEGEKKPECEKEDKIVNDYTGPVVPIRKDNVQNMRGFTLITPYNLTSLPDELQNEYMKKYGIPRNVNRWEIYLGCGHSIIEDIEGDNAPKGTTRFCPKCAEENKSKKHD